jgi:hypothetical protein
MRATDSALHADDAAPGAPAALEPALQGAVGAGSGPAGAVVAPLAPSLRVQLPLAVT